MSCTGNCNQGRACTCADEGSPMPLADKLWALVLLLLLMAIHSALIVAIWEHWLRGIFK